MPTPPFTPLDPIDVGHSRLAYYRAGRGPDLVFVHGWPLHAATFRHVVARLEDRFTCHLIDLPGAGATETTGDRIDMVAHGETVRAAVDRLGLKEYAFVAHDSGGFVARAVAAGDPRVRGLVLGNTEIPGHVPWQLVAYMLLGKLPGARHLVRAMLSWKPLRHSALGFGGCFVDVRSADGEFAELFIDPLLRSPAALDGALALLRSTQSSYLHALRDHHRRIHAPVLLVWGTADPFFPVDKARAMLGQLAGPATLVEIPGGKLFAHEDRADEFARAARPFLERCFQSSDSSPVSLRSASQKASDMR
jgi:pimeloyl-ACP methyl ester carboxylesterase